jgi:hypothetical protein
MSMPSSGWCLIRLHQIKFGRRERRDFQAALTSNVEAKTSRTMVNTGAA